MPLLLDFHFATMYCGSKIDSATLFLILPTFSGLSLEILCPEETQKKYTAHLARKSILSAQIKCQRHHLMLKSMSWSICVLFSLSSGTCSIKSCPEETKSVFDCFWLMIVRLKAILLWGGGMKWSRKERYWSKWWWRIWTKPSLNLRSRRRRATLADVIDDLDDLITDVDDG